MSIKAGSPSAFASYDTRLRHEDDLLHSSCARTDPVPRSQLVLVDVRGCRFSPHHRVTSTDDAELLLLLLLRWNKPEARIKYSSYANRVRICRAPRRCVALIKAETLKSARPVRRSTAVRAWSPVPLAAVGPAGATRPPLLKDAVTASQTSACRCRVAARQLRPISNPGDEATGWVGNGGRMVDSRWPRNYNHRASGRDGPQSNS